MGAETSAFALLQAEPGHAALENAVEVYGRVFSSEDVWRLLYAAVLRPDEAAVLAWLRDRSKSLAVPADLTWDARGAWCDTLSRLLAVRRLDAACAILDALRADHSGTYAERRDAQKVLQRLLDAPSAIDVDASSGRALSDWLAGNADVRLESGSFGAALDIIAGRIGCTPSSPLSYFEAVAAHMYYKQMPLSEAARAAFPLHMRGADEKCASFLLREAELIAAALDCDKETPLRVRAHVADLLLHGADVWLRGSTVRLRAVRDRLVSEYSLSMACSDWTAAVEYAQAVGGSDGDALLQRVLGTALDEGALPHEVLQVAEGCSRVHRAACSVISGNARALLAQARATSGRAALCRCAQAVELAQRAEDLLCVDAACALAVRLLADLATRHAPEMEGGRDASGAPADATWRDVPPLSAVVSDAWAWRSAAEGRPRARLACALWRLVDALGAGSVGGAQALLADAADAAAACGDAHAAHLLAAVVCDAGVMPDSATAMSLVSLPLPPALSADVLRYL